VEKIKVTNLYVLKEKCLNIVKYLKHENLLDLNILDLF